jgi:putative Mn2+ efflux pump MntP
MKKRLLYLFVGFFCLKLSIDVFPSFESISMQILLPKLVFEPFTWLNSILLFIIGFLAISRLIKEVCENITMKPRMHQETKWIWILILGFVFIALKNIWVALAALGISCFYGIMDANIRKSRRYYHN